MAEGHAA
jgi:hypothetical protein